MTKDELSEWINGCYHFAWQLSQIDALERYYHPQFIGYFNGRESFDIHILRERIIECSTALRRHQYALSSITFTDEQLHVTSSLSACLRYAHNEQRIWHTLNKLTLKNNKVVRCDIETDNLFMDHPLL